MPSFYGSFINQVLVLSFLELMRNIQSVLPGNCEFYNEQFLGIVGSEYRTVSGLTDVTATSLGLTSRLSDHFAAHSLVPG